MITHLILVEFHHQFGNKIERIIPELTDEEKESYSWETFPFLALPDGAHQLNQGTQYFIFNGIKEKKTLFCVSVFEQIPTSELIVKSTEMNRPSIQKAICILAVKPFFGAFRSRLIPSIEAFFAQRDFSNMELLDDLYKCISVQFSGKIDPTYALMGLPIKFLISRYRETVLVLFKAILLEKRIVLFSGRDTSIFVSVILIALISLFPGAIDSLVYYDDPELYSKTQDAFVLLFQDSEKQEKEEKEEKEKEEKEKEEKEEKEEIEEIEEKQDNQENKQIDGHDKKISSEKVEIELACPELQIQTLTGTSEDNQHAKKNEEYPQETSLVLITNVPKDFPTERLRTVFEKFGNLRSFGLLMDETDEFRHGSVGFAKYDTPKTAYDIVHKYDDKISVLGERLRLKRIGEKREIPHKKEMLDKIARIGSKENQIFLEEDNSTFSLVQPRSSDSNTACSTLVCIDNVTSDRKFNKEERDTAFHFPMHLFTPENRVYPYACLQQLAHVTRPGGYLCGVNNQLFITDIAKADVILNLTTNQIDISPSLKNAFKLTDSDDRFIEYIINGVLQNNSPEVLATLTPDERLSSVSHYKGSDEWVIAHLRHYIECLYSAISELPSFFSESEIRNEDISILSDFNKTFIAEFLQTEHFKRWRTLHSSPMQTSELAVYAPPLHPMGPSSSFDGFKRKIGSTFSSFFD